MSRRRPRTDRTDQARHSHRGLCARCGSTKHIQSACRRALHQASYHHLRLEPQLHLQQHHREVRHGHKRPATHPEAEPRLSKKPKAESLHQSNPNYEPVAARKRSADQSSLGSPGLILTENRESTDGLPSTKLQCIVNRSAKLNAHANPNFIPLAEGKRSFQAPAQHGPLAIRGRPSDKVIGNSDAPAGQVPASRPIPVPTATPCKRQRKQHLKAVFLPGCSFPGGPQRLVHGMERVPNELEVSVGESGLLLNQQSIGTGGQSLLTALQISIIALQKLGRFRGHLPEYALKRAIVSNPDIAAKSSSLRPMVLLDLLAQAEKHRDARTGEETCWQIGIVTSMPHPEDGSRKMLRAAIVPPLSTAAGELRTLWLFRRLSADLSETWHGFEV